MTDPTRVQKGGERFYRIGGDQYPSVTTVLNAYQPKKETIEQWEERLRSQGEDPIAVRDRAALRGTLAHHRILNRYSIRELPLPEVDLDDIDDELRTDVETCLALWDGLDYDVGDSPHIEEPVWSHDLEYAGTLDMLTNETVVDLKTSRTAFDSHKMQIAAYYYAAREMPSLPDPTGADVIVLHPDGDELTGKVHSLSATEIEHWFGTFTDVLTSYKQQTKII